MSKILVPIKPEYVDEILIGRKKYEYRKTRPKRDNIDKMIIYSTHPIMKVVAEVEIKRILEGTPEEIWKLTKEYSGISKGFYNKYYRDKATAVAYELGEIIRYEEPKNLIDIGINYIPQSFVYINK